MGKSISSVEFNKMNKKLYQKVFFTALKEPEVGLVDLLKDVEGQAATVLGHGSHIMRLGSLRMAMHYAFHKPTILFLDKLSIHLRWRTDDCT